MNARTDRQITERDRLLADADRITRLAGIDPHDVTAYGEFKTQVIAVLEGWAHG